MTPLSFRIRLSKRAAMVCAAVSCAAALLAVSLYAVFGSKPAVASSPSPGAALPSGGSATAATTVTLTENQMQAIKVEAVADHLFQVETDAVGSVDFNEDMTVAVFTPYQGRIIHLFAALGDTVVKGQQLFTLESPDFIAAQSNLISAAGMWDQANSAWTRAKKLYASQGLDQNDYEQAATNQQTAEAALNAARQAVEVFGKTAAEIDQIIATRRVDNALVVRSPISGLVATRNAAPGLLVQPGNAPAPYTVADLSTVWLLANVTESESPRFKAGQSVTARVGAFPGREFRGTVAVVGTSVDPNTHRVTVRSAIKDPQHELRPGMFATFTVRTAEAVTAPAVPLSGVVREGDGTMSVWVTTDRRHFEKRIVRIGIQRDKFDQIVEGVHSGELVAVDGAIFLSNIAFGGAS